VNILGLNAYHGDVAAALVRDGQLVAAVEEERFRRIKHVAGFPHHAIAVCLEMGGIAASDVDVFAVSRDPRAHLWRKALFLLKNRPKGTVASRARNLASLRALPATMAKSLNLDEAVVRQRTRFVEHHPAHLASAAFVSPFDEAAVCAIDGFGDFVSTSWGRVAGLRLSVEGRVFFPHSLGLLYLAITQYLGFPNYGDEFKVMGLAPYGEPGFVREIESLVQLNDDGRFELDLSYFRHWSEGVQMTWEDGAPTLGAVFTPKLESLLGPARRREDPLEAKHEAIAASLQVAFERAALHVLRHVQKSTGSTRLCFAGGCAMNSVANGKIREQTGFRELFIQPAAGDNGTALGAAFYACHQMSGRHRGFVMEHSYVGRRYADKDIQNATQKFLVRIQTSAVRCEDICRETAKLLAEQRVIGWFQGASEFGPRALGNRSLLADPRKAEMKDILNKRVKHRQAFRPFAPIVLAERAKEVFEGEEDSPFMLIAKRVRPEWRDRIPAVVHVDGTPRVQTVREQTNPVLYRLLREFEALTGVPVLINTSFNVKGEPIVETPRDAMICFLTTGIDNLILQDTLISKNALHKIVGPLVGVYTDVAAMVMASMRA